MEFSIQIMNRSKYLVQTRYWGLQLICSSLSILFTFSNHEIETLVILCTHFPVLFIDFSDDTLCNLCSYFHRSKLEVRSFCAENHEVNRIIVICEIFCKASNYFSKFYGYYQYHSVRLLIDYRKNFTSFFHPGRCPVLLGPLNFYPALSRAI